MGGRIMTRYNATWLLSLALASLLVVADHLHGQTKLIDDFGDGNDDGWIRVDLLKPFGLGEAVFDASSNKYVISSADDVVPLPEGCTGAGSFWQPSATGHRDTHRYSNGTLRTTLRFDNDISNGFVALRGDVGTVSLYDFAANNSVDIIYIDRLENGVSVTGGAGLVSAPFDLITDQEYVMEATAVGPHLSMKIWPVGDEEPAQPQISIVDHTLALGSVGVTSYYCTGFDGDVLSTSFDDITFTPGNSAFGADAAIVAIPEPTGFLAMLIGIAGLGMSRRLLCT
jgi:hypothetical protein